MRIKKEICRISGQKNILSEIYDLFEDSGKEVKIALEKLATELDNKQLDMRIAKTAFASSGILGTCLIIGGFIAAPFTFGTSLGLTVAGAVVGLTSGLGGLATALADKIIGSKAFENAEAAIAKYMDQMTLLIKVVNIFNGKNEQTSEEEDKLTSNNLEIFLRGLRAGIDAGGSAAHVGVTIATKVAYAAGTGLTVIRIGGLVLSLVTLPLDLQVMVTNSIKIHKKTPSEVAEQIRGMAKRIGEHTTSSTEADNPLEDRAIIPLS